MLYQKPTLSIQEQIIKLKNKGLQISDEQLAAQYLQKISYYRFRAYTYPFQDNNQPNQPFITPITFEQLVALYQFDSQLRTLMFDALEKIEIALRTQIIYQLAMSYGSHWHSNSSLFRNRIYFDNDISKLQKEINRSDETFIKHYKNKYTTPTEPPCWMSLEVSSFGSLSSFFQNLKARSEKKQITNFFGLKHIETLENWAHYFSHIRNICAHHSRLWNRRPAIRITIPKKTIYNFIENKNVYPYKIYPSICAIIYVLNIIEPSHHFVNDLKKLINQAPFPAKQIKEMGFPKKWESENFWK